MVRHRRYPGVRHYDGDGKADIAVYRPSTAMWDIVNFCTGSVRSQQWRRRRSSDTGLVLRFVPNPASIRSCGLAIVSPAQVVPLDPKQIEEHPRGMAQRADAR